MASLKKTARSFWVEAANQIRPIDYKLGRYASYASAAGALKGMSRDIRGKLGSGARYYIEHRDRFPLEPAAVLFESFWGRKVACNPYACYLALRDDPAAAGLRFTWVRNKGVAVPEDVLFDPRVTFVEYGSRAYGRALATAGCLVSNSTFPRYFVRRVGQRYVNLWHGVPIKHMGRDSDPALAAVANTQRNFVQATDILLSGPYAADKTVRPYGAAGLTAAKVRHIGSPRLDLTLGSEREKTRARLGIEPGKAVILYAPTWRGRVSEISAAIELPLAAIHALGAGAREAQILVSLHHYTKSQLSELPAACSYVPDDLDINEVLAVTDVLVSDYSSIIVDYLVLDRPIVLFCPDLRDYESTRGLYLPLAQLPAALTETAAGLQAAVRAAVPPSSFESYSSLMELLLPLEDGCAGRRAAAVCLERLAYPVATSGQARKRRLLLHPGSLDASGSTTAFTRLTTAIDYRQYEVFVLLDAPSIDGCQARRHALSQIDPRCQWVIRGSQMDLTYAEMEHYATLEHGEPLRPAGERLLAQAFTREAQRVLGDAEFYLAVDFSGSAPFWPLLIAHSRAERKVLAAPSGPMLAPAGVRPAPPLYGPTVGLCQKAEGVSFVSVAEMSDVCFDVLGQG